MPTIVWTKIDEAPALASYSLLPIVEGFLDESGIDVTTSDISLVGRILAQFPDRLSEDQKVADHLAELGELTGFPEAVAINPRAAKTPRPARISNEEFANPTTRPDPVRSDFGLR